MKPIEVSAAVTYYNIKKDLTKKCSEHLLNNSTESDDDDQLYSKHFKTVKIPPSQRLLKRRDAVVEIISKSGDFDKIYKFKENWPCSTCVHTTTDKTKKSLTVCDGCQEKVSNFDNGPQFDDHDQSTPLTLAHAQNKSQLNGTNCRFMTSNHFQNSFPLNNNNNTPTIVHFRNEYNKKQHSRQVKSKKHCYGGNCAIM